MGGQERGLFEECLSVFSVQVGYTFTELCLYIFAESYESFFFFFFNELIFYILLNDSPCMGFIVLKFWRAANFLKSKFKAGRKML